MAEKLRRKMGMDSTQSTKSEISAMTSKKKGISVKRYFTHSGTPPYSSVEWEKRRAIISGEKRGGGV